MRRYRLVMAVLSSALLLASCDNDVDPKGGDSGDVTSSVIEATGIKLIADKKELKVGETLKLTWEIEPAEAETKTVSFTSSNENVLAVSSEGLLTAKDEGNATIAIKLEGTDKSDSIDFQVIMTKDALLSKLKSILLEGLDHEKEEAMDGTINSSIEFNVYKDSLQINYDANTKVRYYMVGKSLTALNLKPDSVEETTIGVLDEDLSQEQVDNYTKLFSYVYKNNAVFGLSSLLSTVISDSYFFGLEDAKENLKFVSNSENSETTYALTTNYVDASVSYDKRYYENSLSFSINQNGQLTKGSYSIEPFSSTDYDFTKNEKKDGAKATKPDKFAFTISYGERKEEDNDTLNRSDYLVQNFNIDTKSWRNKGEGEALLYIGDEVPVEVTNVSPALHLADTYSVESISNSSVINYNTKGNITYLTAISKGEATVTITNSYLKASSIKIKLIDVPAQKIEIGVTSLKEIEIDQTAEYKVSVTPLDAADRSFEAAFENEGMSQYATLTLVPEDSKFTLKGLKAGKVKVIVTAKSNPSISDSIEVVIKAKLDGLEAIKAMLVGATYKNSLNTLTFIDATSGTAALYKGNRYSFNYNVELLSNQYVLVFSNVTATTQTNTENVLNEGNGARLDPNIISNDGKQIKVTSTTSPMTLNRQ